MSGQPVIRVVNLRKVYGETVAVDDISFEVQKGEIFGMVGPNGAGKTTTVECLEGLRQPDSGALAVLGAQPRQSNNNLRQRIGVQLQQAQLQRHLKVWEALHLYASFYQNPVDYQRLLDKMNLADKARTSFGKLSGGQQQRLFIALALINNPELVFFDELTTGLDPQARRAMWELVLEIRNEGKTIVLTTHFMEEAERLCDRLAIVDQGRLIALDTPANLIKNFAGEQRVSFSIPPGFEAKHLEGLPAVNKVERNGNRCIVSGENDRVVVAVVNALGQHNYAFRDFKTEQANLEDVFLALTGRQMRN